MLNINFLEVSACWTPVTLHFYFVPVGWLLLLMLIMMMMKPQLFPALLNLWWSLPKACSTAVSTPFEDKRDDDCNDVNGNRGK